MREPYKIVNMAEAKFGPESYVFIIKYGILERFHFPALISLIAMSISLWLVVEVTSDRMPLIAKVALLAAVIAVSGLLFWYVIKNGSFVLAVNDNGVYYRTIANKSNLVFISWEVVKNIAMYDDGSRELEIETIFEGREKLPAPCNGASFVKDGRLAVSLYPGLTRRTADIMNKMTVLKQSNREPV